MAVVSADPFDARAARYGTVVKAYRDPVLHAIMSQALQPWPGARLLDLAGGQGDASAPFVSGGVRGVALDRNLSMLRQGVHRGTIRRGRAVLADVLAAPLPFKSAAFDLVIMRYALHDCREVLPLLAEIHRVLTPRGRLQIVDLSPRSQEAVAFCNDLHRLKTPAAPADCWLRGPDELSALVDASGFLGGEATWYLSRVQSLDWLAEGQVSEERLMEIHTLVRLRVDARDPAISELAVTCEGQGYSFAFPIVVLTAHRP